MATVPRKLIHADDSEPGITRRKSGRAWAYFGPDGERITDRDEIDRLNKIALPPAYTDAWFCPAANGHIQATGIDDKGRKQYRYHLDYRAHQEAEKFDGCAEFGKRLPKLRKREFYQVDLIGLRVSNTDGAALGEVSHFVETPGGDVMVVRGEAGQEHWVPATKAHLANVDLTAGTVVVDWPAVLE